MQVKSKNTITLVFCGALIPIVLIIAATVKFQNYLLLSYLLIFLTLAPFMLTFEKRKPQARELVVISVMITACVTGRLAFSMIPGFKPVIALIIITGIALGPQAGFMTGALSALVSNIFMGQGSYTPWQMFSWGVAGLIAGLLMNSKLVKNVSVLCALGAILAYLTGFILDSYSILYSAQNITKELIIATYGLGFSFNTMLAIATVIFLLLLAKPMLKKFERLKLKYGI